MFLDTWVGRQSHGLFWRHYRIAGEDGAALLYAVSIWVIMDIESRALTKDHAWAVVSRVTVEGELPAAFKSIPFPRELPERSSRRVTDTETDGNGHLNNCLYLRWGQDLLPEEFARTHALDRISERIAARHRIGVDVFAQREYSVCAGNRRKQRTIFAEDGI